MATKEIFAFSLLLSFLAGVLFSYSCIPMRVKVLMRDSYRNETDFLGVESSGSILRSATANLSQLSFNDSRFHGDDTAVADRLFQDIKILCLVMTYSKNHQKKAIHVNATWGKRCNKLLFVTRTADENLPTLIVNVTDGRDNLGSKTREAFDHAYKHYLANYDWFLKADDDTYVIMENLRYFLSAQDHNLPVFFGRPLIFFVKQGFNSGGAGYVASREALRRIGLRNNQTQGCIFNSGSEDVDFGKCMESLGVRLGDSLDALGRTRFHYFNPKIHVKFRGFPDWHPSNDKYNGSKTGMAALSDYAISFHYIDPDEM